MSTQRADAPSQGGLWGPQPVPDNEPARAATNDIELIRDVIRTAMTRGYVLIGPAQRVFVRLDDNNKGGLVEPIPGYERDAVHQLLGSRHLRTGGTRIVRYGAQQGPATSVLVSSGARAMVTRWGNYRPLR
jgi:hypothetical protein